MITVDMLDLDALELALERLANMGLYSDELAGRLQTVLHEDNRVGVLHALSGGMAASKLTPTKYRMSSDGVNSRGPSGMYRVNKVQGQGGQARTSISYSLIPRDYQQHMAAVGLRGEAGVSFFGRSSTFGTVKSNFFDPTPKDSDPSLYVALDGPPLAPEWEGSRVIKNYVTNDISYPGGGIVSVRSSWEGVTNEKGEAFLSRHFNGQGVPRRDLRGLRPWGHANAEAQTLFFVADLEEGVVS